MSFVWDKFYTIGISEIDSQHEGFVNLLNKVKNKYENLTEPPGNEELKMQLYLDILNLRKYAFNHFLTEEKFMIKSKYPKYFEHKKQHDAFVRKVFELDEAVMQAQELSPQNLIDFMLSWLEGHIQKVDKAFGNYYKAMVGGKS